MEALNILTTHHDVTSSETCPTYEIESTLLPFLATSGFEIILLTDLSVYLCFTFLPKKQKKKKNHILSYFEFSGPKRVQSLILFK